MEPIISGSTTERIVRVSLVTVLAIGAAGWCFYDAFVRYPMQNLERAVDELDPQPQISRDMIRPEVDGSIAGTIDKQTFLKDLVARIGDPGWRGRNTKGKEEARFFGPAGQLIVTLNPAELIIATRYQPAEYKRDKDLDVQVWMGIVLSAIAALLLLHWLRVILAKTTLTDDGIKMTGRRLVPFDAFTEMRDEHYSKKGWLEIDYQTDGHKRTLRLDDYKIKAFPQIIAEICRRKGFEDPYKKWQEQKNARQAPAGQEQTDASTTDSD